MHLIFLLITNCFAHNPEHIVLYPGKSAKISLPIGHSVSVEQKGILRIQDYGKNIHLVGLKTGETRILIAKKPVIVNVITRKRHNTYQKIKAWKENRFGIKLDIAGGVPSINGHIYTLQDWLDLKKIMSKNDDFIITAHIEANLKNLVSNQLKKIASQNGLPYPEFQLNPEWTLAIDSNKSDILKLYRQLFSPLGLKIKHSPFSLSSAPMIEVNILVAEIKRNHLTRIGLTWPTTAQANLVPELDWANPEKLLVQAEAFEQNGLGKVLASPTLIAQSGEKATFHAGGEMPIKTNNQFNSNVVWKKYGIMLTVKPKADFSGKIAIDLDCKVSIIDHSQEIDGVPGLLINHIASHFNLQKSQTIAISGLIKDEWGTTKTGLIGLQHVPLLGPLFSSENYVNQKTELLFFVTPKVVY